MSGEYNLKLPDDKRKNKGESRAEGGEGKVSEGDGESVVYEEGRHFDEWAGPRTVVNFCRRTLKPILLPSASDDHQFGNDVYILKVTCCEWIVKRNLILFIYTINFRIE
jgi:hypothetical protein